MKRNIIQAGTCGFLPGRYNPPQKAHVFVPKWMLEKKVERLIIPIGSSYEVGTIRHLLLAFQREKALAKSLRDAGLDMSRITFVHLPDCNAHEDRENNFDDWWTQVMMLVEKYGVTHFVTGNEENIRGPLRKRNLELPFELINPETEMPKKYKFPFHATDMRKAILEGDYETFLKIAASGTIDLMGSFGGFEALREAIMGRGKSIIPGRQAVDLVVTCEGKIPNEKYVLCGRRSMEKENFPGWLGLPGGGIDELENPMDAAVREGTEETNLPIVIVNRYVEPTHVLVAEKFICEMRFVGLFGTPDATLGGNQGGSSQVFHIHVNKPASELGQYLAGNSDLKDVKFLPVLDVLQEGLAYQQNEMLRKALKQCE